LLAAIGDVIERHLKAINMLPDDRTVSVPPPASDPDPDPDPVVIGTEPVPLRQCPKCGQPGLIRQENCDNCLNCGYSKCGP
jgi:ribonucleoside-diphosphate reductase alpha chain